VVVQRKIYPNTNSIKISERTKAGLRAAKKRGVKLGAPNAAASSAAGVAALKAKSKAFAKNVIPIINDIKASGIMTLRGIANALNARGIKTARGGQWHQGTVGRLIQGYIDKKRVCF
jgi:DNA invertase Pin-like site-specific DNA recombinase